MEWHNHWSGCFYPSWRTWHLHYRDEPTRGGPYRISVEDMLWIPGAWWRYNFGHAWEKAPRVLFGDGRNWDSRSEGHIWRYSEWMDRQPKGRREMSVFWSRPARRSERYSWKVWCKLSPSAAQKVTQLILMQHCKLIEFSVASKMKGHLPSRWEKFRKSEIGIILTSPDLYFGYSWDLTVSVFIASMYGATSGVSISVLCPSRFFAASISLYYIFSWHWHWYHVYGSQCWAEC